MQQTKNAFEIYGGYHNKDSSIKILYQITKSKQGCKSPQLHFL